MDPQAFEMLMEKLREHDQKFAEILAWKYKISGIVIAVSIISGVVMQYVLAKVGVGK
jgi:ABC-type tungstate transport system substrate-binding protein